MIAAEARATLAAAVLFASTPVAAMGLSQDVIPNFVGLGVGVTPQWMGSSDMVTMAAPAARVKFQGERFFELYGPIADVNLLDSSNWEFGPIGQYRFGRTDVDDAVVKLLPEIKGGVELGLFGGYHYTNTDGIPWRLRLGISATGGVGGDAKGSHVTPYASLWMPLSPKVFLGLGAGFTWSSDAFMQQRFGVTPAASTASGLPVYTAGAGVRQVYAWPAVLFEVKPGWFLALGGFYQRITGDAADSPIVTQRGDRNQWTAGAGIGYSWR